MDSHNKILVAVGAGLLVVVLVLGVLVLRSLGRQEDGASASGSATAAETTAASASASSEFETYVLGDGTCKTVEGVDGEDADAVATRFMEISYCFDSMVDSTMTAGMLRASDLMTEGLKNRLVEPERNALQNQWTLAVEHKAYTRPTVTDAATEPIVTGDPGKVYKTKMVSWLWVGRDGATMDGGYATLDMLLVQGADGRWLVDEVATGVFEAK